MEDAERKYVHKYVQDRYSDRFTTYSVPTHRHGLEQVTLKEKDLAELSSSEMADLRKIVDLAVNNVTAKKLAPMEEAERRYVHKYVQDRYSDRFTTCSLPTARPGVEQVMLKRK